MKVKEMIEELSRLPQEAEESKVEMDNSEFDYGHNVKHNSEEV